MFKLQSVSLTDIFLTGVIMGEASPFNAGYYLPMTENKPEPDRKPKGRPPTRVEKLDATPEQAARAFFPNVSKPDPSLRMARKNHNENKGLTWLESLAYNSPFLLA